MNDRQEITTRSLIAEADHHGHHITPVMLKKWRLAGLIPRPSQRSLGRGRGTETVYPVGSAAQLLRLLEIRSEGVRFNLNRALWRLWWEGWPVDPQIIRTRLEATLETEPTPDEPDAEHLPPLLRKLRKRTGTNDFSGLLDVFARQHTGGAVGDWRMKSALPILYRAGGLNGLRRSVSPTEMPDFGRATADMVPIAESIRRLGTATSHSALRDAIAGNPDLQQARNDLHVIVTSATAVWSVVAGFLPDSNAIRDLIAHYEQSTWETLPYAVAYVIALRRAPAYAALFDELSKHSDLVSELRRAIETEDSTNTTKPPRRLQPSGGTTRRESPPACTPSLASLSPPPSRQS